MEILVVVLVIILLVAGYIIFNLNRKVIKQESIIESQVDYLRKVSYLIQESKLYVEQIDEKGTFRADDEVGTFFSFIKEIQDTINAFRLPENYGKTS